MAHPASSTAGPPDGSTGGAVWAARWLIRRVVGSGRRLTWCARRPRRPRNGRSPRSPTAVPVHTGRAVDLTPPGVPRRSSPAGLRVVAAYGSAMPYRCSPARWGGLPALRHAGRPGIPVPIASGSAPSSGAQPRTDDLPHAAHRRWDPSPRNRYGDAVPVLTRRRRAPSRRTPASPASAPRGRPPACAWAPP